MEIELKLKGQLSDTYQKTLELAKNISKNRYQFFEEDIHKDHIRFLKSISKGCKDFKDLDERYSKNRRKKAITISPAHPDKKSIIPVGQKIITKKSGKICLDNMINESYQLACRTKTGRGGIRNLTPSPPPVLEKLRNNKPLITEPTDDEEKSVAYFSLINGKTEEIELPSFKDCIKGNKRIDSQSEIALQKIKKCKEKLGNFEKEINGLEIFCKYNPGVAWNNDKNFLLKLGSNPSNKLSVIRAYNERNTITGSEDSKHLKAFRHKSTINKKYISEMPSIIEKKLYSPIQQHLDHQLSMVSNCFEGFRQAKSDANSKTIKILAKLKAERPLYLRTKANLLISDSQRYKGRLNSFQILDNVKKHVEKERYSNLVKCKEQIHIYTKLLDHLKRSKGMPSQSQISFVEAIREMLEGGWGMNQQVLEGILNTYNDIEQQELADLILIVNEFFAKSVDIYTTGDFLDI